MKQVKVITLAIIAMAFLAACSNKSIDMAKELKKSYQYDGKTIKISGKLETPTFVWGTENRKSIEMLLRTYTNMDNTNTEIVNNVNVNYGEGKNAVVINVPEGAKEFAAKNIVVYDLDGSKLLLSDDVEITGLITYTAKGPKKKATGMAAAIQDMSKIAKDKDPDGNDYTYKMTDVVIKKK